MRRVFTLTLVISLLSTLAFAQFHRARKAASESVFTPFVGTWKLVSSTMTMPDGTTKPYGFGPHAKGTLMYDAAGRVCVQVVNSDRPMWANPDRPKPDEIKTAYDGFGGYCGTFTVDPEKHILAHIPELSFDPNIIGRPSPRTYSFDGDRLIYEGDDTTEAGKAHWMMVWEKAK